MCGITGFWDKRRHYSRENLTQIVENMAETLSHRGPDGMGSWVDEKLGLSLGHRRLSIIDLSLAGHQPMISSSQGSVLIYNGEIYNTQELKNSLESLGLRFQGYSDTEVILEACEQWGVVETCEKLNGMFAFIFWDKIQQKLYLARDRLGKKPLYYGWHQGIFFFGSELKSFKPHPEWRPEIDKDALTTYFRFNYVPAPLSIYQGIQKLMPGTVLTLDKMGNSQTQTFWSLEKVLEKRKMRGHQQEASLIEELDHLLRDAVKRRMVADVPLGAFLSGGVDSSTVVALMQAQTERPVKTFTIGFEEPEYNEAPNAAKIAQHLGTDHHELYLTAKDAFDIIPQIPEWFDEPFADVSQIPTYLVSKLAVGTVKVSLSGDGGDELFAGYHRYFLGYSLWQKMRLLPVWLRRLTAKSIRSISPQAWEQYAKYMPARYQFSLFSNKMYKFASVLATHSHEHFYRLLVSQWPMPELLVKNGQEKQLPPWGDTTARFTNFIEKMQYMDSLSYLPDDILAKVDRASMANSLEARVPLLDHRVVEFSWELPMNMKIRNNQGKYLLKKVLSRYLPLELIERPKMGFGVPIGEWLRGPLREWAENLLFENPQDSQEYLEMDFVKQHWQEHQSTKRDWQYPLWGVIMFQAWRQKWGKL